MDLKQIEKLMSAMEKAGAKKIVLRKKDFEIEIERETFSQPAPYHSTLISYPSSPLCEGGASPPTLLDSQGEGASSQLYVTSPMVGTFYAAPSPDDPPFVRVGDTITENSVVCIIEAMKVMNEVKAGVRGVIGEVLIKSGEPLEFGTHMFRVNPS